MNIQPACFAICVYLSSKVTQACSYVPKVGNHRLLRRAESRDLAANAHAFVVSLLVDSRLLVVRRRWEAELGGGLQCPRRDIAPLRHGSGLKQGRSGPPFAACRIVTFVYVGMGLMNKAV